MERTPRTFRGSIFNVVIGLSLTRGLALMKHFLLFSLPAVHTPPNPSPILLPPPTSIATHCLHILFYLRRLSLRSPCLVSRSLPKVDYRTEDGTANAGSDYEFAEGTLVFKPGETVKGKKKTSPLPQMLVNAENGALKPEP